MRTFLLVSCIIAMSLSTAGAVTVVGKVVGPDGKPVAGAQVVVDVGFRMKNVVVLKTDQSGRFTADLHPPAHWPEIAGRACVYAPGLAIAGGALKRKGETLIRLERAGQIRGRVTDEEGRPVAGAIVRFRGSFFADHRGGALVPKPLEAQFTAKAAQDGGWTIRDVPTSGTGLVMLDDPRFAHVQQQVVLQPKVAEAPPLVARPGATIAGRVVFENGKPAKGIYVFAQGTEPRASMGWSEDTTSPDGSYRLSSLEAGVFNVMADEASGAWVAAADEGVTVQPGQTVKAADIVLTAGAMVTGTVTDEETGKALEGVYVGSHGPHRPRSSAAIIGAESDKQGRYRLRVAPGKSYIYISGPPRGYVRAEQGVDVKVGKGQTRTLNFRLSKGLTLSGVAVDSEGKPAAGARLALTMQARRIYAGENEGIVDTTGHFVIPGLVAGKADLLGRGEWEVVQPKEVQIPASKPVKVILRKARLMTLTGRVVSPTGKPVPGALVTVQVGTSLGGGMSTVRPHNLVSDAKGRFSLSGIRPDDKVSVSAEKTGYRHVSGGEVTRKAGSIEVSDIVLAPLGAKIEGRVFDSRGSPVAGAKVMSPDGDPNVQVVTDSDGRFVLESLAEGEVRLVAAYGHDSGDWRGQADGPPVAINLTPVKPLPGEDVERGYAILEEIWKDSEGTNYYARGHVPTELAPYAPDLALRLARGPDGKVSGETLAGIISVLAEVNPARAAEWAPSRLDEIEDPAGRMFTTAHLGLAVAGLKPELAANLYQKAKEGISKVKPSEEAYPLDVFGRALLAALAARLKDPAAGAVLAEAIAAAEEHARKAGPNNRGLWEAIVEAAARGSPALAEKAAERSGKQLASALGRAVQEISRYDVEAAQRLLAKVKEDEDVRSGSYFDRSAKYIVEALGRTDPARALALAREVGTASHRALALAIAAQFQEKNTAASVFREALQASGGEPATTGRIAAMAYEMDRDLGAELFAEAWKNLKLDEEKRQGSIAGFAFYYSRIDPAESRLMLETEFASGLQKGDDGGRYSWLVPPVLAMAAVDIDRALEMARSIPERDPNARFDAMRKIAQYVLATESVRRTMPFDRWNASDTWMPGTPTGW